MCASQLKISIIIPTKDSAAFLEDTLDSILNQGYQNYEVIVMDGYSTDRTKSICELYQYLQFFRSTANGEADAINKGMSIASGDIVAYMDSDDIYEPGCFKAVNKVFQDNPKYQWVYGKGKIINDRGEEIRRIVTWAKECVDYSYRALQCVDFIFQPSVFMRRSLFEKVGEFRTDLKYSFEYDYWLRVGKICNPISIDKHLSSWRAHPESISIKDYKAQTDQAREIQRRYSGKDWLINRIQDVVYYGTRLLYGVMNHGN